MQIGQVDQCHGKYVFVHVPGRQVDHESIANARQTDDVHYLMAETRVTHRQTRQGEK